MLKPLAWSLTGSVVVEPLLKVSLTKHLYLNAAFGYAHIRSAHVYHNLSYHNKGYYGKAGLEFFIFPPSSLKSGIAFSLGINAVRARFDEWGTARLKGSYFGDLTQDFSQSILYTVALEQTINFGVSVLPNRRLYVNKKLRIDEVLNQPAGKVFPVYYIPGMGNIYHGGESIATDKGLGITGGYTVQLFYKLF